MRRVLIREIAIYAILLITLAFLMHPDLIGSPSERFALMLERGNYFHPFIYAFIIYIVLFLLRIFFSFIKKIFISKEQNK
ncbi:hypothetical protein MNB_SM-7-1130 [hydrothermal vent metagenome]|uniref:Uncharacterized protein n=1 Tax=hydrothermal vent metagenome TaxID=652676 RepID=A0A1W1BAH9_9ZZZZ